MKHYMLVATAISFIAAGTLLADYYQQGSQHYPSSSYENSSPWGSNQPSYQTSGYPTQYNNSQAGYDQPMYHMNQSGYDQPIHHMNQTGYDQPMYHMNQNGYEHPVHHMNQGGYNQPMYQGDYQSMQGSLHGEHQKPILYSRPTNGRPSHYIAEGNMNSGTVTSPSNFTTTPRANTQGAVQNNATTQPRNGANAQMANQGIVKSNDNDKFTTDDDRRLGFQIRQQIAEKFPNLDLNAVALYVDDGSVRISGKVRNDQEKVALSNLIKELKGVKSVNNKLEVTSTGTMNGASKSPLADATANQKYPSYVNPQQKNTFPNSTSNWPNTPAPTTNISGQDSMLADKIRQSIASDHSLSPQAKSIGILVNSKTITLNGTVKSESEKNRLTAKVKGMSEGRLVNNMLEVNSSR